MTKFNEITDASDKQAKTNYVNELWESWSNTREQTLKRITNYLFVLNTGALLAALTYIAAKDTNIDITFSIYLFSFGILCSVLHATLDYYLTEHWFNGYMKDVEQLYENELDWEGFIERNKTRVGYDWLMHLIGWAGAIAFFAGLIIGVTQLK